MTNERILQITRVVLRVALASAFLAAVADRLGFLGPYGSRNVSWGDCGLPVFLYQRDC